MITAMNRIYVVPEYAEQFEQRFRTRAGLVDGMPGFLMSRWREGRWGAWLMGWEHGTYCVGCCWILMAMLFVTGVMNLPWVAAIAVFVIAEKLAPNGEAFGRMTGVVMTLSGLFFLSRTI